MKKVLQLNLAMFLSCFFLGEAFADRMIMTEDYMDTYSRNVERSIRVSQRGRSSSRWQRRRYRQNASRVFNRHTQYDRRTDTTYADPQLTHFITHNSQYDDYDYDDHLGHMHECWVCGGFLREFLYQTNLMIIIFSPQYANYGGYQYNCNDGNIMYGNMSYAISYDYYSHRWYFGNYNYLKFN